MGDKRRVYKCLSLLDLSKIENTENLEFKLLQNFSFSEENSEPLKDSIFRPGLTSPKQEFIDLITPTFTSTGTFHMQASYRLDDILDNNIEEHHNDRSHINKVKASLHKKMIDEYNFYNLSEKNNNSYGPSLSIETQENKRFCSIQQISCGCSIF